MKKKSKDFPVLIQFYQFFLNNIQNICSTFQNQETEQYQKSGKERHMYSKK